MSRRGGGSSKVEGTRKVLLGIILLIVWSVAASFTLLTNQSLIMGLNGDGIRPSWEVLTQGWQLFQGSYEGLYAISIIISWGLLLVYVTISALEWFTPDDVGSTSDKWYKISCYTIVLIDSFANWRYLQIIPRWEYQLIGVVVLFAMLIWCGKTGFSLVLNGVSELKSED
jgi:hypothetical protein